MATSGSVSVAVTSYDTLKFSWSLSSQSIDNNTSTVAWKMELIAGSSGRISSTVSKNWSVTVNGTKYSGTNKIGISSNSTKTLASGSTVIAHNSDGSKTFNFSFSQEIEITFSGSWIGTKSGSGSGVLTTIPRKSSLSASNGTLGTAQTLSVTRKSSSFTHTITYKCGSASGTICTKSSNTSIGFTPPLSLASQNTTGTTVSIVFTIETFNGSTSIGSNTKTISCNIPASVKPSCSLTVTDATGYADKYGGYIKGYSKFKVVVTPKTSYGSAIASYKTTANGSTYSAASFTTDILKTSGTLNVNATVTDKRGRSASASKSLTVLAYSAPSISKLAVHRCNADGSENNQGSYVLVTFSGTVTGLSDKNSAVYTLRYKRSADSEYTTVVLSDYDNAYSVANAMYIFAADSGSSYDVMLTVEDDFDTASKITSASTGFTLMHWMASGLGMAIGKISELTNVLDIGFQTRFKGGLLHPFLEPETDLNDVRTPNTYVGENVSTYNYSNCPLTSGTFTLEVVGMGEDGQVKQRLTYCHKTACRAWERIYYQSAWGEWVCVSDFDGQLLASPGMYMTSGHTATLSEPISKQKNGIVLVFSEYVDGAIADQSFHTRFIPKMMVSMHAGKAHCIQLTTSNLAYFATKYLYISDDKITGHNNNSLTGTGACGITYTNNRFVLRYVIGV